MAKRHNSRSLPYFRRDGKVSFFDLHGVKHVVEESNFKDNTTDGGTFWQFYTYEVFVAVADVSKKGGVEC